MSFLRKQRGKTQSIFLIETIIDDKELERKYVVMGLTGNIYNVTIKNAPECTCPDFITRGNRCKHIYFVLIRVMKTKNEDKNIYNKKELYDMFNNIPNIMGNLIINDELRNTYEKLKQENKLNSVSNGEIKNVDQKGTDDLCPICLDELENGDELDYCKYSCGKGIHKICYSMWTKQHSTNCVFCRASWICKENSNYINLTMKH